MTRRIRISVTGRGLPAATFLLGPGWFPADAGAHGGGDAARNLISDVGAKVATGSQRQASAAGSVKLRLRDPKGGLPRRISVRLTVSRMPSSGAVTAGRATVRPRGSAATVRVRLRPAARKILADCARPLVRARLTAGGRSKTVKRKLRRNPSLCAVPPGVDLSRGRACEFIDAPGNPCPGTYPSDFFTRADKRAATGRRLNLAPDSTPPPSRCRAIPTGSTSGSKPSTSRTASVPARCCR